MNSELFLTLGKIAGLAGISVGFILVIFKNIIQKKIFPNLTREQSFKIIKLIIQLSFVVGVIGIIGWIYIQNQENKNNFELRKSQNKITEQIDSEAVRFLPIDNLILKMSSFNLNPTPPILTLRFRSNNWNISTSFKTSQQMMLSDLKFAIIEHFDLMNSLKFNLSKYPGIQPNWIIRINGKDYNESSEKESLQSLGVKDNDILSLKISWEYSMFAGREKELKELERQASLPPLDPIEL